MDNIELLKIMIMEDACPYYSDSELQYYLEKNANVLNNAAYELLLIKADDDSFSLSGLTVAGNSKYFRRLAQQYRPNNSGVLK